MKQTQIAARRKCEVSRRDHCFMMGLVMMAGVGLFFGLTACEQNQKQDEPSTFQARQPQPESSDLDGLPIPDEPAAGNAERVSETPPHASDGTSLREDPGYERILGIVVDSPDAASLAANRRQILDAMLQWNGVQVGAAFTLLRGGITDKEMGDEFTQTMLGAWCARGPRECLDGLEGFAEGAELAQAKQQALVGWAREAPRDAFDWFLAHEGETVLTQEIGGDASPFIREVFRRYEFADKREKALLLDQIISPELKEAATNTEATEY